MTGMSREDAKAKAREEMTGTGPLGYINRVYNRKSARNNIQMINYAKDMSMRDYGDYDHYMEYLSQDPTDNNWGKSIYNPKNKLSRVSIFGRKVNKSKASSYNQEIILNKFKEYYGENGEDEYNAQLEGLNKGKRNRFYRFVGLRRLTMTTDNDGAPVIDESDSNTIKSREEIEKAEEVQSKTYTVFSSIDNSIRGFFNRLLGKEDDEEGGTPFWKQFTKFGLKVMGVWTLLSLGPYMKKFIQNTVKPFAIELIAPIAPAIDKIGNKIDQFFTITFPTTIANIGRSIIEWGTGTGEYTGSGLPYVFKNKIVPFYMGGIEFLMRDVIPATVGLFFKHLPTMLLNTAKNIGTMWTWSLEDFFARKKSNNKSVSINSNDIVNDINKSSESILNKLEVLFFILYIYLPIQELLGTI